MPANLENSTVATGLEKIRFHSNPKESSNYCTTALISHTSKVMLKILQVSLHQYVNWELPDVQAGFRKGRGTRDQIANIHWIMKKQESSRKKSTYVSLTSPKTLTVFISVQFSSVTQSCPTLCDPMNRSTPGFPVHHQLPEFTQTHVHQVSDAIQPSHPLSSPSPPAPNPSQHQSLFQWVNSSHEVAKVLEFQRGSQQTAENSSRIFRWELTTWLASWEICMQVKKQQLEPDMEKQTGSKLGKECVKTVCCHPDY